MSEPGFRCVRRTGDIIRYGTRFTRGHLWSSIYGFEHFPFVIGGFKFEFNALDKYQSHGYREAVTSQSPGLLQPWVRSRSLSTRNGLRQRDATALRLNHPSNRLTQGS